MHVQNVEGGTESEAHTNGMAKFIVQRLYGNKHAPALWSRLLHAGPAPYRLFRHNPYPQPHALNEAIPKPSALPAQDG